MLEVQVVNFVLSLRAHRISNSAVNDCISPETDTTGTDNAASTVSRHWRRPVLSPSSTGTALAAVSSAPDDVVVVGGDEQSKFGSQLRRFTEYKIFRRSCAVAGTTVLSTAFCRQGESQSGRQTDQITTRTKCCTHAEKDAVVRRRIAVLTPRTAICTVARTAL